MQIMKKLFFLVLLVSISDAQEFIIKKSIPFDILNTSIESSERDLLNIIEKNAITRYIGCSLDSLNYDIKTKIVDIDDRKIAQDKYFIKVTLDISSEFFSKHDYYKDILCKGYDTSLEIDNKIWNSFEMGLFIGLSDSKDSLDMKSKNTKIYYKYSKVPLVGLNLSYLYKILDSQYLGIKLFSAFSVETNSKSTSDTKVRNDGNPAILRVGVGTFYGYRYHLKTDFTLGANFISDSVTRTYTNRTYEAIVSSVNIEAGIGYLIFPSLKLFLGLASDTSVNTGISFVY